MLLVAFASTEGHTRKIAERVAALAKALGHDAALVDTSSPERWPTVGKVDAVIVVASVHEDRHQESASNFVVAHLDQLKGKRTAFISVSLSAATARGRADAQLYVDRFLAETRWSPAATLMLGGALQWQDCDYFQRQVLLHILADQGLAADPKGCQEFTDWIELERFVEKFIAE